MLASLCGTTLVGNSKTHALFNCATFRVIDQLGGKQLVMQLLQHNDASVRYNALLALQKIMVHNW